MARKRSNTKKKTAFYVEVVRGDVEPELLGPFTSARARDAEARHQRQQEDPGKMNGIFWLDITDGRPAIGAYTGGFLDGTFVCPPA